MGSWLENLFQPSPGYCPAPPVQLPQDITDTLPPVPPPPDPEPEPPSKAELIAQAAVIAAAIAQKIKEEDECQTCENCMAVKMGTGGIPPRMPYADTRTNRVGYEYQHHVVSWFHHDAENRIIMEWQVGSIWFDGLDQKEGTMLASRAISRVEYDPALTSYCYLIDTKYGYESWFRYNAYEEEWEPVAPGFLLEKLIKEMVSQDNAFGSMYPNVALIWICSSNQLRNYVSSTIIPQASPLRTRSVYYAYTASEDLT